MSIPAVLIAATTLPTSTPSRATDPAAYAAAEHAVLVILGWLAGFTALSIVIIIRARVYRPRMIVSPDRLSRRGLPGGATLAFLMGLCVWLFAQAYMVGVITSRWHKAGNTGTPDLQEIFTPRDYAMLSTVPPMLAFVALLLMDFLVAKDLPLLLGLAPRRVFRGLSTGTLGILAIGPWVLWCGYISELIYQRFRYAHPMEHDLLRSLGNSKDSTSQTLILLGATVAAPLFEELLFRGHFQTLVRRGLLRLTKEGRTQQPASQWPPVISAIASPGAVLPELAFALPPAPSGTPTHAPLPTLHLERATSALPAWPSILAVVLTSLLFMSVHPTWSWPPIFVLSLGLGYIYERTGNLWAPIMVHLLFNGLQTIHYLLQSHGG